MSKIKTKFGTAKINAHGYYHISSKKEGNATKVLHRLVFEDFYNIDLNEEFPEGVVIHHEDGNKLNNEIWNLVPMSKEEHTTLHNRNQHSFERRLNNSKSQNTTGYYRVSKNYSKSCNQGFRWSYNYREGNTQKSIRSVDINKLKEKVLEKGLEWIEF